MSQSFVAGLLLVFLLTFPLSGSAQDRTGMVFLRFETGLAGGLSPDLALPNLVDAGLGKTMYFGAGAGYQLFERLRTDLTVTYRGGFEQTVDFGEALHAKADFQSTAVMLNAHYEFSPSGKIVPYVGGGIGYVYNHLDQVSITSAQDAPVATINGGGWANFGAQFGGGIAIPIRDKWFVDLGYRYFDGGKYESADKIHIASGVTQTFSRHVGDLRAHDFTAALRIAIN